jgi:methionyl-tRNA synthetase
MLFTLDAKDVLKKMAEHKQFYCLQCKCYAVVCGTCGNNCCNGGNGQLSDGSQCQDCDNAYKLQEKLTQEEIAKLERAYNV